jgi:sugar phosphate isomerase/epimerase
MADTPLPVVGAALTVEALAEYRDWILADGRDLEIQDAIYPEVLDGEWRQRARRARELLDGHTGRVGIHGPFIGLSLNGRDPQVRALTVGRLRRALEFAGEAGATQMVVHSPFQFFGANPFVPHTPGFRLEEDLAYVRATLEEVLPAAEDAGCALVIENIQDANPAPLRALVESFASEWVRRSLDTGHAFITHRLGGPPPDEWVREAGALLAHLHLQDTDGNVDRHWAPGDGAINWFALFEALGELAHRPRLILELRQPRAGPRAAAWLAERGLAR